MRKIYFSILMTLLPMLAMAENVVSVENLSVQPGKQVTMPINLKNSDNIRAMGFTLVLPEGITVEDADMTKRGTKHQVVYKEQESNSYRFASVSMGNENYTGNTGAIINVILNIDKNLAKGEYDILLKEIELSVTDEGLYTTADVTAQLTVNIENRLQMPDIVGGAGFSVTLPINLDNVDAIRATGFVLELPEGVTVEDADLTARNQKTHNIDYNEFETGKFKFAIVSMGNKNFKNNEGAIATITLNIADSVLPNDYEIKIKNVEFSVTGTGLKVGDDYTSKLTVQLVGDIDGDGQFTVNDITALIYLYLSKAN
jgi:ribosomal protein L21